MPSAIEIRDYLEAAILYVSGRPQRWPPTGKALSHNYDDYVDGILSQARNIYRGETGFKIKRRGRRFGVIPTIHATGILGVVGQWTIDNESERFDNLAAANITTRAVNLARTAIEEDFAD